MSKEVVLSLLPKSVTIPFATEIARVLTARGATVVRAGRHGDVDVVVDLQDPALVTPSWPRAWAWRRGRIRHADCATRGTGAGPGGTGRVCRGAVDGGVAQPGGVGPTVRCSVAERLCLAQS